MSPSARIVRLDLLRHLRQCGRAVRRGVLDPVVLRRIVRRGEVDRAAGLQLPHPISNGGRRRRLRNHHGLHTVRRQHPGRLRHKHLAQKARIAAHQHGLRTRLRGHILRDAGHRAPNVAQGEVFRDDRAPPRSPKFDFGGHCLFLVVIGRMMLAARARSRIRSASMIVPASDVRVILSTAGSRGRGRADRPRAGRAEAGRLCEHRAEAHVDLSLGRQVETASEVLLLIKTSRRSAGPGRIRPARCPFLRNS